MSNPLSLSVIENLDQFDKCVESVKTFATEQYFFRELNFALQAVNKNGYLKKLVYDNKSSILSCVYNLSLTGLTLNPVTNYAYLIPRGGFCTVDVSYTGMIKLMYDTGLFNSLRAELVYENDSFEYKTGTEVVINHSPNPFGDRGKMIGGYLVAELKNGSKIPKFMSIEDINKTKGYSESFKKKGNNSIWGEWPEDMALKTIIRKAFKYLPKGEYTNLNNAINLHDADYELSLKQQEFAMTLLNNSVYADTAQYKIIEQKIYSVSKPEEFEAIISDLRNNQTLSYKSEMKERFNHLMNKDD